MHRSLRTKRIAFSLATAVLIGGSIWLSGHERLDVAFRGTVSTDPDHWKLEFGGAEAFINQLEMVGDNGHLIGFDLDLDLGASEQVVRSYAHAGDRQMDQRFATGQLRIIEAAVWDPLQNMGRQTILNWRDSRWWLSIGYKVVYAHFGGRGQEYLTAQFSPAVDGPNIVKRCYLTALDSSKSEPKLEVIFAVIESNDWRIGPGLGMTAIQLPLGIQARCRLPAEPAPPLDNFQVSSQVDGDAVELMASIRMPGYLWQRNIPGVLSVGAKQVDVNSPSMIEYHGQATIRMSSGFLWRWASNGRVGALRLNGESLLPRRFYRYADVLGLIGMGTIVGGWVYLLRLAVPRRREPE